MQLTKLEIKGFKSFGDKVVINFDEGITGIVGPNGCGKSNVVDAIRWVLGEQKIKSLRSEKMENIIFNGTKSRKPTQLAEVSLSFDNTKNILPTEYSNVTITRRYYRSGESEYQLNGVTCRLKDITNLFMDTGIASNSYAIIELAMVDDILNDKDNSRRGLFEEAAGISKFKSRKKETLRKLKDTDTDLERVEDLLFEIEKNLKSLEHQAKQAQKYYQIKEDYKVYSVEYTKKTVQSQKEILDQLRKQSATNADKKAYLNKQLAEQEALSEKAKSELINKEKMLSVQQKSLNDHVHKIRTYESEKKIKNERLRFLNDKSDNTKEIIEQDKKSSERATFSIASLNKEKLTAEKILREVMRKLDSLKKDFEEEKEKNLKLRSDAEQIAENFNHKKENVYQLSTSLEIKRIQLATLKQELDKTTSDTSDHSENIEGFEQRLNQLKKQKKEKQEEYDYLKSKDDELKNRVSHAEKTVEVIREELSQVNRKLDASQNEYSLTKSLVDNLEGFPEAIRFLKKETSWSKNAPLLSDLLTCPEEYRVTVENFLEPYMNYYIVDTQNEAYTAIDILSESAKGKANFFVLERFDQFKVNPVEILDSAVAATEVVEFEQKYKKLIAYLLDNVYITSYENPPAGGSGSPDAVLITKNGKIIDRKFSISGGSVGLFEGKRIGRAKNLDKLSVSIKKLKSKLDEVSQNMEDKFADLTQLKKSSFSDQLEAARSELATINEEYVSFQTKQDQFTNLLTENVSKTVDITEKIKELSEAVDLLNPTKEKEEKLLTEFEFKNHSIKDEMAAYNELLTQKSNAHNQENILFHQQQNKVASIAQEISYKQTNLESSKERIEKNQTELKFTEQEIKALIEKSESGDDLLIEMYGEKESNEKTVAKAEKDYYAHRESIEKIDKESRNIQRQREETDVQIMDVQSQMNETRLELTSVKERLSVEFNVDIDQLLIDSSEENEQNQSLAKLSDEELKEKVEKFKYRLEGMGPVNPMAMEAYDEIKERHDFITTQKEDLAKAKDSLMSTINEIDLVARDTFMEAFEKIKINFIKVFRSLFTEEDQCDLKLSDPEDPLESRIEITAKPKGKRPLTINQLSGGEKTLTATALLFAIYLLKPAPFCIFDEVDAPLDDANIDKFNGIIRDFSNDSQFIIVTHNKRTMAATDIIYGVTMVEQGVSRMVPVDLKELA